MQTLELSSASEAAAVETPRIRPTFDRVVVRPIEPEEVSPGGIFIPDAAQERSQQATVVAVGPGKVLDNGEQIPIDLPLGSRVLYTKYGGTEVKIGAEKFVVLRADDILAAME